MPRSHSLSILAVLGLATAPFAAGRAEPVEMSPGAAVGPAADPARLDQVRETEYYSEPERVQIIGGMIMFCDGRTVRWGSSSPYRSVYLTDFCPGP